jgi:RNA polymerase sigma factor (sigma-70 family)
VPIVNDDETAFLCLMDELQSGSEEAAKELLRLYGDHIYRVVRQRLHRRMRARFDSADFVQIVWKSIFANIEVLSNFRCPEQLIGFLVRISSNKVIDEVRRALIMQKANVNRECSLNDSRAGTQPEVPARGDTPSEAAMAKEWWSRITENQPAHYIEILALRAEGATFQEIAREMNLNERTVRRVVRKIATELSLP